MYTVSVKLSCCSQLAVLISEVTHLLMEETEILPTSSRCPSGHIYVYFIVLPQEMPTYTSLVEVRLVCLSQMILLFPD